MAQPDRSLLWILAVAIAAFAGAFTLEPIPQDPAYHAFADARKIAGIANAWNVVTNLPFLVVGLLGLASLPRIASTQLRTHYLVLCTAVALVAFGSAHYHFDPSTRTLVWDRLPMTVAFMAFFSAVVADRVSWIAGRALLWPTIALGIASIAWWIRTEQAGEGDLRLYGIVQFLPMILIPMMLVMRKGAWLNSAWLWAGLAAYLAAKLAEYYDAVILAATGGLSGHSLKHLLAALASWWVLRAFRGKSANPRPGTGQRSPASAL